MSSGVVRGVDWRCWVVHGVGDACPRAPQRQVCLSGCVCHSAGCGVVAVQNRSLGVDGSTANSLASMMPSGSEVAFETRTADSLRWFEVPMLVYQLQGLVMQVVPPSVHGVTGFPQSLLLRR